MKADTTIKTVIQCPECNAIQEAKVEKGNEYPYFNAYIHTCNTCGYVIMESEWDEVKDDNKQ
jgi:C4-type Zn-finger protein